MFEQAATQTVVYARRVERDGNPCQDDNLKKIVKEKRRKMRKIFFPSKVGWLLQVDLHRFARVLFSSSAWLFRTGRILLCRDRAALVGSATQFPPHTHTYLFSKKSFEFGNEIEQILKLPQWFVKKILSTLAGIAMEGGAGRKSCCTIATVEDGVGGTRSVWMLVLCTLLLILNQAHRQLFAVLIPAGMQCSPNGTSSNSTLWDDDRRHAGAINDLGYLWNYVGADNNGTQANSIVATTSSTATQTAAFRNFYILFFFFRFSSSSQSSFVFQLLLLLPVLLCTLQALSTTASPSQRRSKVLL